jgi:hypothetical protein
MVFICCTFSSQVSGAGYNDQGEIHIHKCDSLDRARESIYTVLEVRIFMTDDDRRWAVVKRKNFQIPEKAGNLLAI